MNYLAKSDMFLPAGLIMHCFVTGLYLSPSGQVGKGAVRSLLQAAANNTIATNTNFFMVNLLIY